MEQTVTFLEFLFGKGFLEFQYSLDKVMVYPLQQSILETFHNFLVSAVDNAVFTQGVQCWVAKELLCINLGIESMVVRIQLCGIKR